MLTQSMHDALVFIVCQQRSTGVSPTYVEIGDAIGIKSRSAIFQIVNRLEERGFVRRVGIKNAHRAIEVLRLPPDMQEAEQSRPLPPTKPRKDTPHAHDSSHRVACRDDAVPPRRRAR